MPATDYLAPDEFADLLDTPEFKTLRPAQRAAVFDAGLKDSEAWLRENNALDAQTWQQTAMALGSRYRPAEADIELDQQGPLGTAVNAFKNLGPDVVQGVVGGVAKMADAASEMVGLSDPNVPSWLDQTADLTEELQQQGRIIRPLNPANPTAATIGSGAGQAVAMLGTAGASLPVLGARAMTAVPAAMGFAMGAGSGIDTAQDMGITSPAARLGMGTAFGAIEGATEMIGGIGGRFIPTPKGLPGMAMAPLMEGGEEMLSQAAQDATTAGVGEFVSDPNRPGFTQSGYELPAFNAAMLERQKQAAIGGAAGGAVFAGVQALAPSSSLSPNDPLPPNQTPAPAGTPQTPGATPGAAPLAGAAGPVPSTLSRIAQESLVPDLPEDTGALTADEVADLETANLPSTPTPTLPPSQTQTQMQGVGGGVRGGEGQPTASVTKDSGVTADQTAQNTPGAGLSPATGASLPAERSPEAQAYAEAVAQATEAARQAQIARLRMIDNKAQGMPLIPDSPRGDRDILDFANENPIYLPPGFSEDRNLPEYEKLKEAKLPAYWRQFVASSKRGGNPEQVAQRAFDAGLIPEPDAGLYLDAVREGIDSRKQYRVDFAAREQALAEEEKQVVDFEKTQQTLRRKDKEQVRFEDIAPGDEMMIDGEQAVVKNIEYNEDGYLTNVVIEDGKRFGLMNFDPQSRQGIFVDEYTPKQRTAAEGVPEEPLFSRAAPRMDFSGLVQNAQAVASGAQAPQTSPALAGMINALGQRTGPVPPQAGPRGVDRFFQGSPTINLTPTDSNLTANRRLADAYREAVRGTSTQMAPLSSVYAQARLLDPTLTVDQFLTQVQDGYNNGTLYLEGAGSQQEAAQASLALPGTPVGTAVRMMPAPEPSPTTANNGQPSQTSPLQSPSELAANQKANEAILKNLGLPTQKGTRVWGAAKVKTALAKLSTDERYPATTRLMARELSNLSLDNLLLKIEADARLNWAGLYQPFTDGRGELSLNTRTMGRGDLDIGISLVHEALHHATYRALRAPKTARQKQAAEDLRALFTRAKAALAANGQFSQFDYELSSLDEFITGLWTRADFQTALAGIPMENAPTLGQRVRSVLDETFRVLAELVTGKAVPTGSVLEASMAATLRIMGDGKPSLQSQLKNAVMTQGPGPITIRPPSLRGIKAYHGTPHKVDKFSTSKIGSGEGAQAYGWGLYFAEEKDVARGYQVKLAREKIRRQGDQSQYEIRTEQRPSPWSFEDTRERLVVYRNGEAVRDYPVSYGEQKAIESVQSAVSAGTVGGNLYTVELIPDEADFLDWDKPLSEQSEKVKAALAAFGSQMSGSAIYADVTQKNVIPRMENNAEVLDYDNVQTRASKFLQSRGIPGIKYLDAGSRGKGDGSRNFVVFDEKDIRITHENEMPLMNPAMNPFTPSDAPGWMRTLFKVPSVGAFRVQNLSVRQLLTGSALPKAMAEVVVASDRDKKSIEYAAATLANDLEQAMQKHSAATGQTQQQVNDLVTNVLQGALPLTIVLDPELRTAIRRARNLLDSLSTAVAGATTGQMGQTILANLGSWMRRSYAAFDPAAGWSYDELTKAAAKGRKVAGEPASKILADARRYLRSQTPGLTLGELEAQMRQLMDRNLWEEALIGSGAGVRKDVTSLMKRKDIAPEIRALMGEERNPVKKLIGSAKWQAQFIAKHENQQKIRDVGLQLGMFSPSQTGRFTEELGEDRSTSGFALNGQKIYTTPELRRALGQTTGVLATDDLGSNFLKMIYWLGGQAKLNKVALNPDSWMVNLLGNFTGLAMTGGLSPFAPLRLYQNSRKALELLKAGKKQAAAGTQQQVQNDLMRQMMAKLTAAGVADSSMNAQLVEDALNKNLIQFIERHDVWNGAVGAVKLAVIGQALAKPFGATARAVGGAAGGAAGYLIGNERVQGVQEAIAKWTMQNPDRFGKIVEFLDNHTTLIASGMTPDAAFAKATTKTLNTMPDYSKLPAVLRQFSRLGVVGSFIAFQWEVYRNSFHNAKYIAEELGSGNPALMEKGVRRLLGMSAVYALALGGLQALLGNDAGDDEKDEAYRRALGKPWEKYSRLAYSRLDTEKASFYNTSYLLPQVTLTEIIRAAAEGKTFAGALEQAGGVLQKQFAESGIHADPLLALLFNFDKGGQKATSEEGYRAALERLAEVLAPMTPGAADKFERILRSGEVLNQPRWDREFSVAEEMKRLIGIRQATYAHDRRIAGRLSEFNSRKRDITATAAQAYGETGKAKADVWGKQQQQQAAQRATERLTALKAEYDQFVKDLGTLGFKPTQIERFRKDAGTSPNWRPYGITAEGIKQQ